MCNNVLLVEMFKIEQFITKYRLQEAELNNISEAVNKDQSTFWHNLSRMFLQTLVFKLVC